MNHIISALKHCQETETIYPANASINLYYAWKHRADWSALSFDFMCQAAQIAFENIEAMRVLLTRGGRPLPDLPSDFQLQNLITSLDRHSKELVALQSVLELMEQDKKANILLDDIWKHFDRSAKRDVTLLV